MSELGDSCESLELGERCIDGLGSVVGVGCASVETMLRVIRRPTEAAHQMLNHGSSIDVARPPYRCS